MATYKYLEDNNPDGTMLGRSASALVGMWGTVTVQPAATAQSAVPTTVITTVSSTSITTLDLTKINAAIGRIEEIRILTDAMRTALVASGVMKGSL